MGYYIVRFINEDRYYRSRRLMVTNACLARKFSSKEYAKKAVKNSCFAELKYEVIEISCENVFK